MRLSALAIAALIDQALDVLTNNVAPSMRNCAQRLRQTAQPDEPGPQMAHELGVRCCSCCRLRQTRDAAIVCKALCRVCASLRNLTTLAF